MKNLIMLYQIFKTILSILYIIKKHETVTNNPSIMIYVNKIENRITFKIKTGYYLKLLTPETTKVGYGFLSFAKNMGKNIGKNISKYLSSKYSQKLDHAKQSPTNALKTGSKRAISKDSRSNW